MIFLNLEIRQMINLYHFNMIKEGDWIIIDDYMRKKCFGKTERGNYLIKMYGKLMQVPSNRVYKANYGK